MYPNNLAKHHAASMGPVIGGPAESQPQRESEISSAITDLNYHLNELRDSLGALHARLVPVMRQEATPETIGKGPRSYSTPLAGKIGEFTDRVNQLREQVNFTLNQLEI